METSAVYVISEARWVHNGVAHKIKSPYPTHGPSTTGPMVDLTMPLLKQTQMLFVMRSSEGAHTPLQLALLVVTHFRGSDQTPGL